MNFNDRLDRAIGLLEELRFVAEILGQRFRLTEDQLTAILEGVEDRPFFSREPNKMESEKQSLLIALDELIGKGDQRPPLSEVVQVMKRIFGNLHWINKSGIMSLSKYIHDNWEDLLMLSDVGKKEDPNAFSAELERVPKSPKYIP
ncbi:MAG: hypothetical protein Q8K86_08145 [Candidatus Nanopelagicaceae bacterium]|nr:hypothetical protein [Candidatus Nanopelagicaceae bacterium]